MSPWLQRLDANSIDLLFAGLSSHNWWQDRDVTNDQLRNRGHDEIVQPVPPQPARLIFIRHMRRKRLKLA